MIGDVTLYEDTEEGNLGIVLRDVSDWSTHVSTSKVWKLDPGRSTTPSHACGSIFPNCYESMEGVSRDLCETMLQRGVFLLSLALYIPRRSTTGALKAMSIIPRVFSN